MHQIFPVGVPVVGKDLVGRKREVEEIKDTVKIGQSVILTAPRKYGKTSLILEVLHQLKKEDYFTGFIDLFGVLTKRELAEKIVDTVLMNLRVQHTIKKIKENLVEAMKKIEIKQTVQDFEFILGFCNDQTDEDSLLDTALDFPEEFAKKSKRHLVFVFDEFGDLYKMNGDALIKKMRAEFQMHRHVTYIFSGSQESLMQKLFGHRKSAFFRFGRIFYLAELPAEDLRRYIIRTFKSEEMGIKKEVVDEILTRTNCHPYYTQLLCQLCYLSVKNVKPDLGSKLKEKKRFAGIWKDMEEKDFRRTADIPKLRKDYFTGRNFRL